MRIQKRSQKGQSTSEYLAVLTVMFATVVIIGFIGVVRGAFDSYFQRAQGQMVQSDVVVAIQRLMAGCL